MREVHDDVAAEQRIERVAHVDPRGELGLRRLLDSLADGPPHAPPGAKDSDLDH
jgi:hypothetical protein